VLHARIVAALETLGSEQSAEQVERIMEMTFWLPQAEATLAEVEGE
jgi:hypothetical protein